jgi:hypothetical protein
VLCPWEAAPVCTHVGHQDLGRTLPDLRNDIQAGNHLLFCHQVLVDHRPDPGDGII